MNGTKNEARKPQEDAISCQTMLELMGLPAEAKKKLALMLVGGELDLDDDQAEDHREKQKRIEPESFYESTNAALELSLMIERMRAVAECFADDYIDLNGQITTPMAVAHSTDHFNNLFNAIFCMIVDIDAHAKKLTHDLDQIWKDA